MLSKLNNFCKTQENLAKTQEILTKTQEISAKTQAVGNSSCTHCRKSVQKKTLQNGKTIVVDEQYEMSKYRPLNFPT